MATPIASGAAMTRARIDETMVPYRAGAAPKLPLTGSQSLETRKSRPNSCSAGQAATPISIAIAVVLPYFTAN